ncbi:hypothetical protein QQ045_024366 [Rhodiola kirilowii]
MDVFRNIGEYNMWLAAENGMFLRPTKGSWMTTMPEHLNMEWFDSVKHVFGYFTERTPRSHFELRETSLVWNYKYAGLGICLMMVYRSAVRGHGCGDKFC